MPYSTPRKLHPLTVKIPRTLFDEVRILALDPETGQARYGFWPRTLTMLLRRWLDEQRSVPLHSTEAPIARQLPLPLPDDDPLWKSSWAKKD